MIEKLIARVKLDGQSKSLSVTVAEPA